MSNFLFLFLGFIFTATNHNQFVLKFILSSAIKIWNSLPNNTIESININQFKQSLADWQQFNNQLMFVKCNFRNYFVRYTLFRGLHNTHAT